MVMPSSGPRKPRRRASKALCVTRPGAIRSKAASAGATGPCARAMAVREAREHLLAAAPARDEADAGLGEAHGELGMGLDRVAVQQEFATAAEREARRRAHDRDGGVLHRLEDAVALVDPLAEAFRPRLDRLRGTAGCRRRR